MVNSFAGALQVIGVRAVINDVQRYLNDGKRIEIQTAAIARAQQQLEKASYKADAALRARNRGDTAAFQAAAIAKITSAQLALTKAQEAHKLTLDKIQTKEAELTAGRVKSVAQQQKETKAEEAVNKARTNLIQTTQKAKDAENALIEAKKRSAEADLTASTFTAANQQRVILGPNLPSRDVTAATNAARKAANDVLVAERALQRLREQGQAQVVILREKEEALRNTRALIASQLQGGTLATEKQLLALRELEKKQAAEIITAETKLGLTRGQIGAKEADNLLKRERELTLAKEADAAATVRLEAAEKKLQAGRFAGAKSVARGGLLVGGFAAAGTTAASLSAGIKFEDSLTKIDNLTSLTTEDTKKLGEEIKKMAASSPKSADDLGAAAYFIAGRGILTVDETINILRLSMKAAVGGFATTEEIAKSLTGVVQSYGKENITAAQASDILFAAVKVGGAEFGEFATQIGPVLPIARNLGVTFDQVAAAMATLTVGGISTSESATAVRAIMVQILSPSKAFSDVMEEAGTSTQAFRAEVRDKGLVPALQDLIDKFGGNIAILDKLFPEVRGLTGAFALLKGQGVETARIQSEVTKSLGTTDDAFKRTMQTTSAQFQILKGQLNVAFIELGSDILPEVNKVLQDTIKWFIANREGIKNLVALGLKLLFDALKVVVQAFTALSKALAWIPNNQGPVVAGIALIGAAMLAAWGPKSAAFLALFLIINNLDKLKNIAGFSSNTSSLEKLQDEKRRLENSLASGQYGIPGNQGVPTAGGAAASGILQALDALGLYNRAIKDRAPLEAKLVEINKQIAEEEAKLVEVGSDTSDEMEFLLNKLKELESEFTDVPLATDEAADKFKNFVDILEDGIISFEEATKPDWEGKIKGYTSAMAGGIEAMEGLRREEERIQEETFNFEKALARLAVTFQRNEQLANKMVLAQARTALSAAQTAGGAIFGNPTQEVAKLQLEQAKIDLLSLQTNQRLDPLIKAAEQFKEARDKILKAEIEAAKDQMESRKDAMDAQLEALEEEKDRIQENNKEEEDVFDDRKRLLQDEIDDREEYLDGLKEAMDDELRAMDRARQLRDRDLDDTVDALNKQKEYLKGRQDIAIGPAAKRAIQKQIDAIDTEIESRQNSSEALKRQDEDKEFMLKEEQIAREREEDDRKNALERQIEAIDEEVRVRQESNEKEVKAIDERIEALKKSNEREEKAMEDRQESLDDAADAEIQRIDDLIDSYNGQKEQVDDLGRHFSDQTALLEAQHAIWEAEQVVANNALLTEEELRVKHEELKDMIFRASEQVREFARLTGEELIPELKTARDEFFLLQQMVGIATDQSIRDKFIPQVDFAAEHARLMALAMEAAAERLDNSSKVAAASIQAAAKEINEKAASAISQMHTAQEQYEAALANANYGGGSGGVGGGGMREGGGAGSGGYAGPLSLDTYDNVERWRDLVSRHFPADEVQKALNIMALESSGDPGAANVSAKEASYGLFQINTRAHNITPTLAKNPDVNVAYAAKIWNAAGRKWGNDWVNAARQLGYAERGALVTSPRMMMMGEHNKPELILPLTNMARSQELVASLPPAMRAAITKGGGGDTNVHIGNISLPNADGRNFIPQLEDYMSRKLRLQKRGVTYG